MNLMNEYSLSKHLIDETLLCLLSHSSQEVCYKLPVDAIPISKKVLDELEAKIETRNAANINPFNMRRIIEYNMHGSDQWVGKYDMKHFGDYI